MIIDVPGVGKVEFPDGTDSQVIEKALAQYKTPQTNMVEQSMSGVNEGIAGMLGMPVDAATGGLNGLLSKPKFTADMALDENGNPAPQNGRIEQGEPAISNPVGGSESFLNLLAPTISDTPPQTTAQRYGRRVGQEVGAMAIPGGAMMRGAKAPLALGTTEAASAVGSGIAGQTSQEIAPGNETADLIASMMGGMSPVALGRGLRPSAQAPSMDQLKSRQRAAYDAVDSSQSQLTPQATSDLQARVSGRAASDGMDPFLAPKASRTSEKISSLVSPRISEVEKTRRLVGRDVAGAVDPTERAIGSGMKDEITEYLNSLKPSDVTSGDPAATVASLREGRDMTQRIKKSEEISNLIYKGENRAATSGTGGNEVNAIRQNIRGILDNPKKRRGYSSEEIEAMEQIVRGTPAQNLMRALGRFSPTSGALPAMASGGMLTGAAASSNPLLALPPAIGMAAKSGAEYSTKRSVSKLDELIRNKGPLAKKTITGDDLRAYFATLLSQSRAQPQ